MNFRKRTGADIESGFATGDVGSVVDGYMAGAAEAVRRQFWIGVTTGLAPLSMAMDGGDVLPNIGNEAFTSDVHAFIHAGIADGRIRERVAFSNSCTYGVIGREKELLAKLARTATVGLLTGAATLVTGLVAATVAGLTGHDAAGIAVALAAAIVSGTASFARQKSTGRRSGQQ